VRERASSVGIATRQRARAAGAPNGEFPISGNADGSHNFISSVIFLEISSVLFFTKTLLSDCIFAKLCQQSDKIRK
jgi:hypothetical protein